MSEPSGYLVGVHEFIGRNVDELDIHKGDYVEVIEDDREFGDSWYIGRNLSSGKSGLFPKVFTTAVAAPPPEVLERAATLPDTSFVFTDAEDELGGGGQGGPGEAATAVAQPGAVAGPDRVFAGSENYSDSNDSFYGSQTTEMGARSGAAAANGSRSGLAVDTRAPAMAPPPQNLSSASLGGPPSASVTATMSDIDAAISEIAAQGPSLDAIGFWTPHDVQQYLLSRGYDAATAAAFEKHRITGLILLELDLAHLKEIDITSFGTRFEISKEIKYLNRVVEETGQVLPTATTPTIPQVAQMPSLPSSSSASNDSQPSTPLSAPPNVMWNSGPPRQRQLRSPFSDSPQTPIEDSIKPGLSLQSPLHPEPPVAPPHAPAPGAAPPAQLSHHKSMRSSEFEGLERCETPGSESEMSVERTRTNPAPSGSALTGPPLRTGKDSHGANPQAGNMSPAAAAAAAAWSPSGVSTPTITNPAGRRPSNGTPGSQSTPVSHQRTLSRESFGKPYSPSSSGQSSSSPPARPDRPKRNNTLKNFRSASSQYLRTNMVKQKTSAFTEGIQQTTAEESARTAQASGWMQKRGGMGVGSWKPRFFTLHGTRLSYFATFKDDKERGLIDITGHRVLAAKENEDKLISLYAAGVGAGRHCFKLVPPAPGYRKGVSFTAPKTHYFACETKDEMRTWMSALMKATIERDESVPVISSCTTPSVSLPRAQEIIAERLAAELDDEDAEDLASVPSSQPVDTPPQTPAFSVPSSQSGSAGIGK